MEHRRVYVRRNIYWHFFPDSRLEESTLPISCCAVDFKIYFLFACSCRRLSWHFYEKCFVHSWENRNFISLGSAIEWMYNTSDVQRILLNFTSFLLFLYSLKLLTHFYYHAIFDVKEHLDNLCTSPFDLCINLCILWVISIKWNKIKSNLHI